MPTYPASWAFGVSRITDRCSAGNSHAKLLRRRRSLQAPAAPGLLRPSLRSGSGIAVRRSLAMVISSEGMEPDMYLSTDQKRQARAGRSGAGARLVGMSETLRTAEEVAERLRVPKTWVYRAAREGHLPSVRCGRYRRFDDRDVDRWIDGQRGQAVESVG